MREPCEWMVAVAALLFALALGVAGFRIVEDQTTAAQIECHTKGGTFTPGIGFYRNDKCWTP